MGKKRRLQQHAKAAGKPHHAAGPPSKKLKGSSSASKKLPMSSKSQAPTQAQQQAQQQQKQQHEEPTIPFSSEDAILLVGEGDLSFAASLVTYHGCLNLTATVQEKSAEELVTKYPHAAANITAIDAEDGCRVLYGIDARKMGPFARKKHPKQRHSNLDHSGDFPPPQPPPPPQPQQQKREPAIGLMDRILFNFPHVGGKSTDVNRQVRYNQELLVDFFRRSLLSLAPGGTVVVTLFEGEPYTLWNVRDLGRHAGLQVERSFRFHAAAYPGYHHARTLGVVRSRTGEAGGGWRGEERAARSYVFVRRDETPKLVTQSETETKRKRKADEEDDDDDSSGEDG